MSSFHCKIRIKKTGEVKQAYANDDYFGQHQYGYADGDKVYREEEVEFLGACQPDIADNKWEEEFDELYGSFKLCDVVNKKDYDRLKAFISKQREEARKEVIKEIEDGTLQLCDCCGEVKDGEGFICGTCEDCI